METSTPHVFKFEVGNLLAHRDNGTHAVVTAVSHPGIAPLYILRDVSKQRGRRVGRDAAERDYVLVTSDRVPL